MAKVTSDPSEPFSMQTNKGINDARQVHLSWDFQAMSSLLNTCCAFASITDCKFHSGGNILATWT